MHFTKVSILLIALLTSGIMAAPAPEAEAAPAGYSEEPAPGQEIYPEEPPHALAKRGFGCPGNPYQCNEHVRQLETSTICC